MYKGKKSQCKLENILAKKHKYIHIKMQRMWLKLSKEKTALHAYITKAQS